MSERYAGVRSDEIEWTDAELYGIEDEKIAKPKTGTGPEWANAAPSIDTDDLHLQDPDSWASSEPAWVIREDFEQEELGLIKTGKEADVILVHRTSGDRECYLALKRYRPREQRAFRREEAYRNGMSFGDERVDRAVKKRTKMGRQILQYAWAYQEFPLMRMAWESGVRVPYPVDALDDGLSMQYLGNVNRAAPRLAEIRLDVVRAQAALGDIVEQIRKLLDVYLVHGDLSPYNIVYWNGRPWLIDFPQAQDIAKSPRGLDFLARDIKNVCTYFRRCGLEPDPEDIFHDVLSTSPIAWLRSEHSIAQSAFDHVLGNFDRNNSGQSSPERKKAGVRTGLYGGHMSSDAIRVALRGFDPTDEQWEAITAPMEPLAIIAGAGTGKTAIMAARIVHLVAESRARRGEVLGLTFTNKAASELSHRVASALRVLDPGSLEYPLVTTYHSFASRVVSENGARIGIDPDSGLLTTAQKWQMLMAIMSTWGDDSPFEALELRHPLSFIPQVIELSDHCANHLVSPEELAEECRRLTEQLDDDWALAAARKRKEFARIISRYGDEKRKLRRIDFGDQIVLAVQILREFGEVADELRRRYPAIFLDEYQDTSPAQKIMIQQICPAGSAVTAVGDARQAIYGWRGASMYNLINFGQDFPRADGLPCLEASLSENYRSGSHIIGLANDVIAPVPEDQRPGELLVAHAANGTGSAQTALFADQDDEARFIADEIERLHSYGLAWKDMAVLVRTKASYMDRIVAVLESRDIPVETPELGGLLKIPAVVDTVAWIRVLDEAGPSSNRWLARILMGPAYRIHYRDLAPIAKWASAKTKVFQAEIAIQDQVVEADPGESAFSLQEALEHVEEIQGVSAEAAVRIQEFNGLLSALQSKTQLPLPALVRAIITETGLEDALTISGSRAAASMRGNLAGFEALCAEFDPLAGEASLETFVEYLDVAEEASDPIPLASAVATDSVKLMTIHGAKGLEFEAVFLPILSASQSPDRYDKNRKTKSVFPDVRLSNPIMSTKQLPPGIRKDSEFLPAYKGNSEKYKRELRRLALDDERRLFYVAVSRARQRLYCTGAHWYASQNQKGPSEFLDMAHDHPLTQEIKWDEAPGTNPLQSKLESDYTWPPKAGGLDDTWIRVCEDLRAGLVSKDDLLSEPGAREIYESHLARFAAFEELEKHDALQALSEEPFPSEFSESTRKGIEVHLWVEQRSRGLSPDLRSGDRLGSSFVEMGFDSRKPALLDSGEPMIELPFTLKIGDRLVRGRIDAVYETEDGLEVVDFKTGELPPEIDWAQLELYAEALGALGIATGKVTLTYVYLSESKTFSRSYDVTGTYDEQGFPAVPTIPAPAPQI